TLKLREFLACGIRIARGFRVDYDFNIISQLQALILSIHQCTCRMTRDVFPLKSDQRGSLANFGVLVIRDCFSLNLERVSSFDLHIAIHLDLTCLRVVDRTGSCDLIRLVSGFGKDLKINILQFVMAVRESDVTRGAQPEVQAVAFGEALLIAVYDTR